ncbi:MAG: CocE/NonD family hydrolase, partial [Chloroflexi bacterium]|nr:CocE/NonD family hydrolase [Chloroflexota bacterium]
YPERDAPGPTIGFMQECLRWWDYWHKGIDTGIMDEPMVRVWMQDNAPPSSYHEEWPGRWVAEESWPSPNITMQSLALNADGTLGAARSSGARLDFVGAQHCGLDAGIWCPTGAPGELPPDQRSDDGLSLCFTSAPLDAPMEILGLPEVTLTLAADRPNALVAVRLCDVAPDGASTLASRGLLNLTHRDSHENPSPLEPGKRYTVTVRLNVAGHSLPAGHRWRVAVSPTYWPYAWPSPRPVTLSVFTGAASRLDLPVRKPRAEDAALAAFEPPEISTPLAKNTLRTGSFSRTVHRDVASGRFDLVDFGDSGSRLFVASGLEYETINKNTFTIVEGDPLSASVRCDWTVKIGHGDWRTRVETSSVMTSDAETFRVTNVLDAFEGNTRVFGKTWTFAVPRDCV